MTGTRVRPAENTGLYGGSVKVFSTACGLPPLAAPAPAGVASQA